MVNYIETLLHVLRFTDLAILYIYMCVCLCACACACVCVCVLLTKHEVKMAEYWPSSFSCIFVDQDELEVHKNTKGFRFIKNQE